MPFRIIRDDITRMHTDAIVNTANPHPVIGGGTDSAIYHAAGAKQLLVEREKIGEIAQGQAAITPAFQLNAKYIIHTVGPKWNGGQDGEEDLLRSCYENSLRLAKEHNCKSISFPLISTGVYGFPKDLALQIVMSTISKFLTEEDMMIYLVVFGQSATRLSERLFEKVESRIDENYVEKQMRKEYALHTMRDASEVDNIYEQEDIYEHEEMLDSCVKPSISAMDDFPAPNASIHRESIIEKATSIFKKESVSSSKKRRSIDDIMKEQEETFSEMLLRLIKQKDMTNKEAYTKANQDKKLFSKIKNNPDYQPKKKTAMAFALALELNLDETKDLLARAGYAFSPSSKFDQVIQFLIEEQMYDIYDVEIVLYDLGLGTLCNYNE